MLTTKRLVISITFLALFAMATRISMDTDTWWHLRTGAWIIENREIPRTDPFSYTRGGEAWEYPGWLVQVPMYLVYNQFGPGGLNILTGLCVTLAFIFIWRVMSGGVFLKAFVLILAATASGVYWAARPYMVTFVFSAVFICVLEEYRTQHDRIGPKALWWLPLVMVVWANSHGGFAAGFLILGVYWTDASLVFFIRKMFGDRLPGEPGPDLAGKRFLHLSTLMAALIFAVCVNPNGFSMLQYPLKTINIGALQDYIQEWQSPDFHSLQVQPFAWLLFLCLGVVGMSGRRINFTDFALTAGFAYMGLVAGRNIALFGLAAPILISRHAEPVLAGAGTFLKLPPMFESHESSGRQRLNGLILGILIFVVVVKVGLVFPAEVNRAALERLLPVEAVDVIRETRPPGRLFNSYNWGGYLLWALPEYPVFIDGRTDLYNDEIIQKWLQVVRAEQGWEQVLDDWDVRLVLVEADIPLARFITMNGEWTILYQDQFSILLRR